MFFLKKVLILFGGNSSEHYVSCKSCKSVIENIDTKLFTYEIVGISIENKWYKFNDNLMYLENGNWLDANILEIDNIIDYLRKFDVVFPVMHGTFCEDGKLQGMLELFNIKFVGCKTLASAIGMDKGMSKFIFDKIGIPNVPYLILEDNYKINDIIKKINFPMIIKPANGGSSIGIHKAKNKRELVESIKKAKKYDKKIIIEKFIQARELEIAVLENQNKLLCSLPGEINSANEFYDYDAKYINKSSYTTIPDDLSEDIVSKLKDYAIQLFHSLGCNGFARIDFFYDEKKNNIYINEINTIPGFTSISMFPKLIENEGIRYSDLITILINNA